MAFITIKDLQTAETLDDKTMLAVRGGLSTTANPMSVPLLSSPSTLTPTKDISFVKHVDASSPSISF